MSDEYVQTDEEHPTGTVRIELDESMVPKYTIAENVAWDYLSCDERNEDLTLECRAVCFGSLVQRLGTPLVLQQFVSRRINKRHPELIIFDVNLRVPFINSFALRWGFDAADWRKINAEELKYLSAVWDVEGGEGSDDCFPLFVAPSQNGVIILTSGERGSVLFRQQEVEDDGGAEYYMKETTEEPAISAQVVDTVGAGDAFTAAMVVMHLEGRPLRECARFANHYAARVCEHRGATPRIDRREVELAAFGK
jgi:fructokinase